MAKDTIMEIWARTWGKVPHDVMLGMTVINLRICAVWSDNFLDTKDTQETNVSFRWTAKNVHAVVMRRPTRIFAQCIYHCTFYIIVYFPAEILSGKMIYV